MMPDKTYHPREVLRNQEKNKQNILLKLLEKLENKSKNFINDNIISELRTRFKEDFDPIIY